MFKMTKLITFAANATEQDRIAAMKALATAAAEIPQVAHGFLQPTLPNVYNGGDAIWHLHFADEAEWRAGLAHPAWSGRIAPILDEPALVAHVDGVAYEGGRSGSKETLSAGVYRTLLLSANQSPSAAQLARFEAETFAMGHYIHTIRTWQVSAVTEAEGARPWTHVWEQEYADLGGLMGAYMLHPHHWGHIDRWYDPECTDFIVDPHLCHTFCAFSGPVISP